jgi:hypothetical protein
MFEQKFGIEKKNSIKITQCRVPEDEIIGILLSGRDEDTRRARRGSGGGGWLKELCERLKAGRMVEVGWNWGDEAGLEGGEARVIKAWEIVQFGE